MIRKFFRKLIGLDKRDYYICLLAYSNLELQNEIRHLKSEVVRLSNIERGSI